MARFRPRRGTPSRYLITPLAALPGVASTRLGGEQRIGTLRMAFAARLRPLRQCRVGHAGASADKGRGTVSEAKKIGASRVMGLKRQACTC